MSGAYHATRFTEDPRRTVLWNALWHYYFRHLIAPEACVLDLGAGFGTFINSVTARRRIALDAWPDFVRHLAPGVEGIVGDVSDLAAIGDASVDFAFASNVFEHITQDALARTLAGLRRALRPGGTLTILQPNYRYAYREYFDDYTHVSIYSHISLADFLASQGWDVFDVQPRFMPLTIKSRLPVAPWLIGLYLRLPIKPMGKQMLVRARPR